MKFPHKVCLNFCLVLKVLILIIRIPNVSSGYQGCYKDSPVTREMTFNPGRYSPVNIDATECEILCGNLGYGYAGLTAGIVCLCGQTMTLSTSGTCDEMCPGDVAQICGKKDIYDSIYTAPISLSVFKIVANDVLETYAASTINFNITTGVVYYINGTVYDGGTSFYLVTTPAIVYNLRHSGDVAMKANASTDTKTLFDSTVLKVQTRVKRLTLTCDPSVVIQTRFECFLDVAMGTDMDISVSMGDGTTYNLTPMDTRGFSMGQMSGVASGETYPGDNLYLMPEHTMKSNGTLAAFEFEATTTGLVYIQVYSPFCSAGSYYCAKSNTCIQDGQNCTSQSMSGRWKHQCGTGTIYSLAKRRCVDKTTGQVVATTVIDDWSKMPFPNYTFSGEIAIDILNTGQQFYEVPDTDLLSVAKGDILAIKEPTGELALLDATGKNNEFYYDVNADGAWSTRTTLGYNLLTTPTVFPAHHALKAYLEKPSRITFRHTFTGTDYFYNVTATATNNVTIPAAESVFTVEQLILISSFSFVAPFAIPTNESFYFNLTEHVGSKPVYTWDFGNGCDNVTLDPFVPFTYNESGVYTVTVTAANDVNAYTTSFVIIVQDVLEDLNVNTFHVPTIWGNLSSILWNVSQGTNVTYKAIMGDGQEYTFNYPYTSIDLLNNSTSNLTAVYNGSTQDHEGYLSHLYPLPDFYEFTFIAENHVSKMNVTFTIPVQDLVTGLVIHPTPPIWFNTTRHVDISLTSGSHLQIYAALNGTELNQTSFDEAAGNGFVTIFPESYLSNGLHILEVNITNLVSPIVYYTLEVWIDYPITDLSIMVDRPFLPVGDPVQFDIEMFWCSRFTSTINFNDTSPIESRYDDLLIQPEMFNFTHVYLAPGIYHVNFTIDNPVDFHNSQHDIYVQYGVKNLDVKWTKTVRLEPGAWGGPATIWVRFMGGVPFPTLASYFVDFDDNNTATDAYEIPEVVTQVMVVTTPPVDCEEIFRICFTEDTTVNPNVTLPTQPTTTEAENTTSPTKEPCPQALLEECLITQSPNATELEPTIGTTMADDFVSIPIHHAYYTENTYNVSVNVSNLVSFMFFTVIIDAEKPIYNLKLTVYPRYVPIDTNAELKVTMSWGSRALCTWDIGDGSALVTKDCDHYAEVSHIHPFHVVGVYHAWIYSKNSLGTVNVSSSTGPIYVQIPVTKFSLRCPNDKNNIGPPWSTEYHTNVEFELLWEHNNNRYPTNASYTIDFGDGTVTAPTLLPTTFQDSYYINGPGRHLVFDFNHNYTRGGNYSVKINIWNLVSNKTYSVPHDLYEGIVGLDVTILDYDVETGVGSPGGGDLQNYFAQEHPVQFIATLERGSHVTYNWTYGDTNNDPDESFYYQNQVLHEYDDDICYDIKLRVQNFNNSASLTRHICVQRGCYNISISCDHPRAKNSSFYYQVHPGTVGSDACYLIDLSDMADPHQYVMFGDATQCSIIPEWNHIWNDPDKTWFSYPSDQWYELKLNQSENYNYTLESTFTLEGYYDVTMYCQNKVSNESEDFKVGVTKGPCWWPYVNVSDPNQCTEPFCDPVTDGLKTHYKSEKLVVKSDVIINCTATKVAYFWWHVFHIDEESGNETEITDLNGADVFSIGARQLILEPRTLDYGLYRFELNVSMNEVIGMYSIDSGYVRIIPTPITVEILGGDFMMRGWGEQSPLNVDGQTMAFDPDVDPSDKSGMQFIWMCRRICEQWPEYNADWTIKKVFTTNCTYSAGEAQNDRGCSKVDGVDTSGILPNASRGILDTLFSGDMYENDEVEIKIVVIKGSRMAEDTQRIYIAEGDPPILGLNCITNCNSKVNTDSRYGLATYIDGWTRGVYFYYRWTLYAYTWSRQYIEVPDWRWIDYASTGKEGPTMAILPNCPYLQSNSSRYYYFRVKTWRWGTSELLAGLAEKRFYINERPSSDSAYISASPTVGIAYETKFRVEAGGFKDYEDGSNFKLYKFGYRADFTKPYVWFHEGRYANNYGSEAPFVDGLPEEGYDVEIICRAYDQVGAFADKTMTVKVEPPNQQDVSDMLVNATSETGIVNNLFVGADIKVAPVAKCLGKFLNEESEAALTNEQIVATTLATTQALNLTETERLAMEQQMIAERESAKLRRTETRAAILNGFKRIKAATLESLQNTAAALSELTKKEDEMSEVAQDDTVEILRQYTDLINADTKSSANDREEASTTLIEGIGNMLHSAGYLAESAEVQSTALFNQYYETGSTTPSGITTTTLTAAQYQAIQDDLNRKKAKGKETFLKVEEQMNELIRTVSKFKVVGEQDAILESPKLNCTLRKKMTINMNENPYVEVGGHSSVLQPKSQSIFGETGNETTYFVETEALRQTVNVFTWTDTSAGSAQSISSDVISFRYRNDSGQEVPVKDNSQMFDIFVDRTNFDTSVTVVTSITRDWDVPMIIHSVEIENTGSLHINLQQILNVSDITEYIEQLYAAGNNNTNETQSEFAVEFKPVEWIVFIKANEAPTIDAYDFNCTLPLTDEAMSEMLSYMDTARYENDTSADRSSYINEQPDRYTCFYTSEFLAINETTTYFIGIKHNVRNMTEDDEDYWLYYSTLPPTTTTPEPTTTTIVYTTRCSEWYHKDDTDTLEDFMEDHDIEKEKHVNVIKSQNYKNWRKACTYYPTSKKPQKPTTPAPTLPSIPPYRQAVYKLSIFSAYCIWWDRTMDRWSNEGCEVGPLSTPQRIHCLSSHLTSFAAGFAVPMNTINLDDSAFTKLDENPIIFCTMVSLMCLYILMCIWARKRDLVDKIMAGSSPLPDNDPRDKYLYELQVFTGARKGAGTTAKVSFILTGEKEETAPRYLADEKRPVLQVSNIDGFVMAVPRPLGKLTHLRIWHDNMGSSPEWYFSRMQVEDLQTGDKYFFICENWLSLDEDDGLIDRMIPVAGRAELTSFNYLFWTKAKYSIADGHLWFSIFKRPAKSNFTRVQRLTCCLALLFATMVTSIAFYKSDEGSNPKEYGVGPVTVTPTGLYIGIVSGLMSLPVNILIVCLFRYSKPFPKKVEETLSYRFFKLFKCLPCFKKKIIAMDEKQVEEEKNDLVGQARHREKSDLDANAVKIELENELEALDKPDKTSEEKIQNTPPPKDKSKKKPSAELAPIPRILTLKKEEEGKKEKKPFRLPYWGIYFGYALAFCTVAVAFWATVEFGGVFGPKKSLEWLVSFFISCVESIFFSQPIKVLIIAVIYAVFIKKPEVSDDENDKQLEEGEEWLHTHMTEEDLKNPDKMKELEKMKSTAPLPPELDFLKTAKEERQHELRMYSLLKEIVICVFFLYFILMIAYTNRDPWSYRQYNNYNNIFNLGAFSPSYTMKFEKISTIAHFWNWTENAMLNGLYNTDWYNGDAFTGSTKLIQDRQSILVGSARLRQLRTMPYECVVPKNYLITMCRDDYGYLSEDEKHYGLKWTTVNMSDPTDTPHEYFSYKSSSDIGGYPYWGIFSSYDGGGYVAELGTSLSEAQSVLYTLMDNNWVDNNTRAIFIEVNLYNPNNNLWGVCLYVLEFLQTGGIEPFERFFIFRLDRYGNGFMYFVMAIELITMAFVIFYTVKEWRNFRQQKWAYFKDFWNVWEVIVLGLAYALVIVFIYRSAISVWMMRKVRDNPDTFVNFFLAVVVDECCGYFIGILAYMETLRFLRLLRFNKKVALFGSTLFYVAKPLLSFSIVFTSGFLAFSTTAYFFFMTYMFDFRTFSSTIWTLLSMMLGKFDYEKAWTSTRVAGPIIFGMFALAFNFVLVNFFLTLVIDGFQAVRNDLSKQSNDYEVVDHLMKKLKMMMGIDVPKKRKPGYSMDPRLNIHTYIEGKDPDQEMCDELNRKVDNVINSCNNLADCPDQEELAEELQEVQAKKKRKIVTS